MHLIRLLPPRPRPLQRPLVHMRQQRRAQPEHIAPLPVAERLRYCIDLPHRHHARLDLLHAVDGPGPAEAGLGARVRFALGVVGDDGDVGVYAAWCFAHAGAAGHDV